MKKIAVFTSGGDAPGMNAAIRAVTRNAHFNGIEVYGIISGYKGMIEGTFEKLIPQHVSGIIQKGGTILKTARSKEFRTSEGRLKAYNNLREKGIDAVIVIGGDGSFQGASKMVEEFDIPFVGIPGTIDNDIYGTDYTIGYDTCLNTVVNAVDNIRDTASAHDRLFFIEVMGKEAGFVALNSGIACGAESILIPEVSDQLKDIIPLLKKRKEENKSSVVLVAEGDEEGHALEIAKKAEDAIPGLNSRVTILGHIQRGGTPSCYDRVTASRFGAAAVEAIMDNKKDIMIGLENNEIVHVPLHKTVKMHKNVKEELFQLTKKLL